MTKFKPLLGAVLITALTQPAMAHDKGQTRPHATDHAPIGVMSDHRHKTGELMISYRFMSMEMDGSRDGTNSLTPEEIATTTPNRFANTPGQPPTLRVVPTDMQMDMHMVGAMYGLTDRVTLMGMTSYVEKSMNHLTFQGGMGATVLGGFETTSKGIGDSTFGAIIGLDDRKKKSRQVNLNVAISLPTGSITETDQVLTPTGATPTLRLPYPMQLGTGTYDFKPGITYFDRAGKIGWGTQASARIPLGRNSEDYKYGSMVEATTWLTYEPEHWVSISGRVKAKSQGDISGIDASIIAPVQTADPDFSGGDMIEAFIGVNLAGQSGALKGHRLAFEYGVPLYRNLNGPQLETDSMFTLGWQKSF